jgi:hypothetical protein
MKAQSTLLDARARPQPERVRQMSSEPKAVSFDHVMLGLLAEKLRDHADSITNVAAHQMELDVRLAAMALDRLAAFRLRLVQIADACERQGLAVTAYDLTEVLREFSVPS